MPAPDSVVLETSLGNIQLELYWDHAPRVCLEHPFVNASTTHSSNPIPDMRELCTAGQTRILQWRDISSNRRRTFQISISELKINRTVVFILSPGFHGPGR
jgi:hypothetical protein